MIEPSSKQADSNEPTREEFERMTPYEFQQHRKEKYQRNELSMSTLGEEVNPGTMVEVTKAFTPVLYRGWDFHIPEDRTFTTGGMVPADPEAEAMAGVDVPSPVYPDRRSDSKLFTRIRLIDDDSGTEIYVLPQEFSNYFAARGDFPRPVSNQRGTRYKYVAPDPATEKMTDSEIGREPTHQSIERQPTKIERNRGE